jgi:hypothetical protein
MPHVSVIYYFEGMIFHLDLDKFHPSDRSTCLLLVFYYVAPDPAIRRHGTPEELGQEFLRMKSLEALKSGLNPHHPSRGDMWHKIPWSRGFKA